MSRLFTPLQKFLWGLVLPSATFCIGSVQQAHGAGHEKFPGNDLVVHFVRLTGYDKHDTRELLLDKHRSCASGKAAFGEAFQPLSAEQIPVHPLSMQIEIYYSENRTLDILQGKGHEIKFEDCSLGVYHFHTMTLRSSIGRCDINMVKKIARGVCDAEDHRRAPRSRTIWDDQTDLLNTDLSKIPPHTRPAVQAQIERLKQPRPGMTHLGIFKIGPTKTIAQHECEVTRLVNVKGEKCIANPQSSFPIPPSPLNLERAGLLLEDDNHVSQLRAEQVILHMNVSEKLFSVPSGFKIISVPVRPQ